MKKILKIKAIKRYFQLIEVMVALFLIASCAIPVMGSFVYMYKEQKALVQTVKLDHLSHVLHARITEELYQRGAKGESFIELLDKKMSIQGVQSSLTELYDFSYMINILLPTKSKREKSNKFLLQLDIIATKKNDPKNERIYSYKAAVKREYKEGQQQQSSIVKDDKPPKPPRNR